MGFAVAMELPANLLSWRYASVAAVVYFASLAFYRLFLHSLARFPGPKLAAITRYYEAYYDIVRNGQYTFKIADMHKKYGPIVRISPYELHVIDPTFFEKLYRQDGVWDKYAWAYDGFSAKGATICTPNHEVHKARRLPLSPLFSKAKVLSQQDLIWRNLDTLCDRIVKFAGSTTAINLGAAISAFTRDVSTEFILGKNYNSLHHEDFNVGMTNVFQDSGYIWRVTKHVKWFGPTLKSIPIDWVMKTADDGTKGFFRYLKETTQDTKNLMETVTTSTPDVKARRTIVHEILDSKLPHKDKTFDRIFDDVATVTGAGFETTASVLRLIVYHAFSDPKILDRLRAELTTVTTQSPDKVDLRTLEKLPYLTSTLMEGLRLSPAIASRMARIAPDRDLVYGEWRIPAGTPIGMTTLLMHHDETLYPNPKHFNPDRWMDLDARKKAEKTYAPFSRGTRMCLGMYLAWAEMYLLLATFVQRFDFQFEGIDAQDFECESDQFIIGTKGKGILKAFVTVFKG